MKDLLLYSNACFERMVKFPLVWVIVTENPATSLALAQESGIYELLRREIDLYLFCFMFHCVLCLVFFGLVTFPQTERHSE